MKQATTFTNHNEEAASVVRLVAVVSAGLEPPHSLGPLGSPAEADSQTGCCAGLGHGFAKSRKTDR